VSRRSLRERAQATVEAALGIFVFVTVLVFGIHFAELGHITLKIQEAVNAAMWDSTSQQMHDVTAHTWSQYTTAIMFAESETNTRYRDFDALRTSGSTTSLVFTRATDSRTACRPLSARDRLQPSNPMQYATATYPNGEIGITCEGSANFSAFRIPSTFLDGNMSRAPHLRRVSYPACAIGRPRAGGCPGALSMLLDDWGYVGQNEARECALAWEGETTCSNQGYYDQVNAVYVATPAPYAGSATRLASLVAGSAPIDEDFFYMSFRGSESPNGPYMETVQSSHGDLLWETTPFRPPNDRYDAPRDDCWLGNPCP